MVPATFSRRSAESSAGSGCECLFVKILRSSDFCRFIMDMEDCKLENGGSVSRGLGLKMEDGKIKTLKMQDWKMQYRRLLLVGC